MATANTSILINSISGRIGSVVFYTRPGNADGAIIQCVRTYVIPRNPDTEAQREVRRTFGGAVRSWQAISPEEQRSYNHKARYLNMSGYNLYISIYIKRVTQATDRTLVYTPESSRAWNLEPSTWNHTPIHSVSASSLILTALKSGALPVKIVPG